MTDSLTAYFKVDNLFGHDPTPAPQTNTALDTDPDLYDLIGRTFRLGVRYDL